MRFFTKEEDGFLKKNYKKIPAKRMSKILGRTEATARQRMKLLGIVVPADIVQRFKEENRFKKGQTPPNKGKKMPKDVYEKVKGKMFKKGNICQNKKPLGSIRITKDGYMEIKTSEPNLWEHYHRLMWEETFGTIPDGKIVRFVTKDKLNVHPFNLELIDRADNMKKNSIHAMPEDLRRVVQMMGALNRQINKRL